MDTILQSSVLPYLGPSGLALLALLCCWFLWNRMSEKFEVMSENVHQIEANLKDQIAQSDDRATKAFEGVQACQTEHRAATANMAQQTAQFQLDMASSRPSRDEMDKRIATAVEGIREVIAPMANDVSMIKNFFMQDRMKQ